jgi:hypothetical protein
MNELHFPYLPRRCAAVRSEEARSRGTELGYGTSGDANEIRHAYAYIDDRWIEPLLSRDGSVFTWLNLR